LVLFFGPVEPGLVSLKQGFFSFTYRDSRCWHLPNNGLILPLTEDISFHFIEKIHHGVTLTIVCFHYQADILNMLLVNENLKPTVKTIKCSLSWSQLLYMSYKENTTLLFLNQVFRLVTLWVRGKIWIYRLTKLYSANHVYPAIRISKGIIVKLFLCR